MSDWGAGYVTEVEYTYGYYPELNPLRLRLALLRSGLRVPEIRTACELGFGQGLAINFHSAGSPVQWWGTDFSPSQTKFAQDCARAARTDVHLYNEAFSQFCSRRDLPDFDYIALHGIWSWISHENWAVIVDFVRRKLNVGGMLYISYNTMPGWAAFAPIQHLLLEHANVMAARGRGIVSRFEAALDFAERMIEVNPRYALANPRVGQRLKAVKALDPGYATHEYLCEEWHPLAVADMARWLEPAKVSYACSAHYLDHVDVLNLTAEQRFLMSDIADPIFRETVRDFMVNQQFRRDYWVKGARRLSSVEQVEAIRTQRVILGQPRRWIPLTATGVLAEAQLSASVYTPILDALGDQEAKTIAQLEQSTRANDITLGQLLEAVMVLGGTGALQPAQEPEVARRSKAATDRLNNHLLGLARSTAEVDHLASPVTGGGVRVSRIEQLLLYARSQGRREPAEWARAAWELLALQQQRMLKADKLLETPEENLAELTEQARNFAQDRLPVLRAMGVA